MILKKIIGILYLIILFIPTVQVQGVESDVVTDENQDIVLIDSDEEIILEVDSSHIKNPKKAAMLSAAFPGVGQIYNGDWWKAPIVYAGLGGLGFCIYLYNDHYNLYRNGYLDYTDDDYTTRRYNLIPGAEYAREEDGDEWMESTLENRKDSYRRNRDLFIIATIGVYVLNIIEANVAAHMSDFDVSDDLSMKVAPTINYDLAHNEPIIGVSLIFNINK